MSEAIDVLVDFDCPRCHARVAERFYGPCGSCRDELSATLRTEQREVMATAYVPKANVVANFVATKE